MNTRRGFTLMELLVVILILVLVIGIAVPAFTSMMYSSEQSLTENALKIGLTAARDAASRNASGEDGAAVFFYEPGGRVSIVACTRVGRLADVDPDNPGGPPLIRDVFVPVPGFEAVQLPGGWSVRAYAPPETIDGVWYEDTYAGEESEGNWVFPETAFFDVDAGDEGAFRQTFMVRFEGGTGMLKLSDPAAALVLSPSPSGVFRANEPFASYRADRAADGVRFVRRVLASTTLSEAEKQELLGDGSSDTVLARSVGQVAAYHERTLAASIRARLDRATNSLYQPPSGAGPKLVAGVNVDDIDKWIEGTLVVQGTPVDTDARVFAVQRYLGWLQEMPQPEQQQP